MSKKIVAVVVMLMLFAGVVHASSMYGEFNGNPIVRVKSNGVDLPVEDTPAIVYEGRTMVPVYMLKNLGANVTWDQDTFSVDISLPEKYTPKDIAYFLGSDLVDFVTFTASSTTNYAEVQFMVKFDLTSSDTINLGKTMFAAYTAGAKYLKMSDFKSNVLKIDLDKYRDFVAGKITATEFANSYDTSDSPTYTAGGRAQPKPSQPTPSSSQQPITITPVTPSVIESKIDGDFEGWEGETIFKLTNGQIWQQDSYAYKYTYKYMPKVTIYKDGTRYKMIVDGVDGSIYVKQLK